MSFKAVCYQMIKSSKLVQNCKIYALNYFVLFYHSVKRVFRLIKNNNLSCRHEISDYKSLKIEAQLIGEVA